MAVDFASSITFDDLAVVDTRASPAPSAFGLDFSRDGPPQTGIRPRIIENDEEPVARCTPAAGAPGATAIAPPGHGGHSRDTLSANRSE
jgi:hypothetical protein